jgi:hypothetical protein
LALAGELHERLGADIRTALEQLGEATPLALARVALVRIPVVDKEDRQSPASSDAKCNTPADLIRARLFRTSRSVVQQYCPIQRPCKGAGVLELYP